MGCCSQTTAQPWWGDIQKSSLSMTQRKALGIEGDDDRSLGQWYTYIGLKHGALQHPVGGKAYYAGRLGSDRFVKVETDHVAKFEGLYGSDFALLGASDEVTLPMLMYPAYQYDAILPGGVTERLLRQHDLQKAGDVVGADPARLAQEFRVDQGLLKTWILAMRAAVGFGNSINLVAAQVPATMQSAENGNVRDGTVVGKVEVFDFAVIAGITPGMENLLLEEEILSSSDFVAAGDDRLAQLLNVPLTTVAGMKEDLRHYVSSKDAPTKIRVRA